jgi:anion-transporting  ArsA/GET3 family ATPase
LVVDMPATGHALAMLGVPRGLLGIVGVGPIARRARDIDALLHDETRTAVCVVTLPEELPVNESVELVQKLQDMGLETRCVLVNGVVPTVLDAGEQAFVSGLRARLSADGAGVGVVDIAERLERRRLLQRRHIEVLKAAVGAELVEIGETARRGLELIDAVVAALLGPAPVAGRA